MPEIRLAGSKTRLFPLPDLEIDEFVPVVKIDSANFNSDKLAALLKGDKVDLSSHIDEPLRTIEMDIVVAVPGEIVVTCTVAKGRKASLDDDGIITPRLVAKVPGVTVKVIEEGKARYGQAYQFIVVIEGNAERTFQVDLFANDDAEDANSGEFKDVLCGRIEVRTWPDVFSKADADRLIEEMNFIGVFAPTHTPGEYAGMYCMKAADRGLSALLGNTKDFYSVDRNHMRLNEIDHGTKGALNRGDDFQRLGFVHSNFESDEYVLNEALVKATVDETTCKENAYLAVTLPIGAAIGNQIRESCRRKSGFHIYYLSVTDDFHTLILVVDNRHDGKKSYKIYDQEGLSSSRGNLVDIETGLERQTSWTFMSSYLARKFNFQLRSKTISRLWKIQRNS